MLTIYQRGKVLAWNDQIFRNAVDKAAREAGKTRTAALEEAGIAKGWLSYDPKGGRQVDMLAKLMVPLGWAPADLLNVISDSFGWQRPEATERPASANRKSGMIVLEAERLHLRCGRVEVLILPTNENNQAAESIERE